MDAFETCYVSLQVGRGSKILSSLLSTPPHAPGRQAPPSYTMVSSQVGQDEAALSPQQVLAIPPLSEHGLSYVASH